MSNLSSFVTADLHALVRAELDAVYDGDSYHVRPDPGDVIADVLGRVRADIRSEAAHLGTDTHVDQATAEAIVLSRLADWMED